MNERPTITLQPFHDEAFTAEKTGPQPLLKCNADTHAFCRRQERLLLSDELAADLRQLDRNNLPWIWRREGYMLLPAAGIHEDCHE